jgi:opacity protein-like surface antigen
LKFKLTLIIVVLALASMAQAQGALSNLSIGAGFEGIFPAATYNKAPYISGSYPTTQSTTNSVGILAPDVRYDFGKHSAVGVALTINRNTEYFSNQYGTTYHVQTNNGELIGTYIFRLPATEKFKPYAMVGGGMVRFAPNNDSNTGNQPSPSNKPAFAYGFGGDFKMSDHWGIRVQYRGLVRTSPDFKLSSSDVQNTFGTLKKTHVPEPAIEVFYHF